MSPTCPFQRMVCTGAYTGLPRVLFGRWSAPALTHVFYLSISADGLQRLLHMSPTCPFRRMVRRGSYTCLLLVLFGGWSAQAFTHVSHVSFSADGLHRPLHVSYLSFWRMVCIGVYTFRRMVCTGPYMSPTSPFGEWSAQAITRMVRTLHPAPYIASGPIAYLIRWVVLVKPRH